MADVGAGVACVFVGVGEAFARVDLARRADRDEFSFVANDDSVGRFLDHFADFFRTLLENQGDHHAQAAGDH